MSDQMTLQGGAVGAVSSDRFVKADAASARESFKVSTAISGKPLGIAEYTAVDGEGVNVITAGKARLYCDGSTVNIARGDSIKPSTGGKGVKAATPGDDCNWKAAESLTTTGIIWVYYEPSIVGIQPKYTANSTNSVTLAVADLALDTTLNASFAGAVALAIPGAASVPAGTKLTVMKSGSAGAVTITPAAGTIAGSATYAALDAQGDTATFISDGTGDWKLGPRTIA